jgi:hypothetical protein
MNQQRIGTEWFAAIAAILVAAAAVVLDLTDHAVNRWFNHHAFTTNIAATVLGLAIGALVIDRIVDRRQLKARSRVMASQSAIIAAQAVRATDTVRDAIAGKAERDAAADEVRTLTTLLMTSADVLLQAKSTRAFLEDCDRLTALLARSLSATNAGQHPEGLDQRLAAASKRVHAAAEPIMATLSREQLSAVPSLDSSHAPPTDDAAA